MNFNKQKLAYMFLIVLLVASLFFGLNDRFISPLQENNQDNTNSSQNEDKVLVPDFTFTDINGEDVSLSSLEGKPVIINFWASWCIYCELEMPDFEQLVSDYSDDVHIVMLNAIGVNGESEQKALDYLQEEGFTGFTPYFDSYSQGVSLFGISSYPTTVFIDSEGYLFDAIIGKTDYDTVSEILTDNSIV